MFDFSDTCHILFLNQEVVESDIFLVLYYHISSPYFSDYFQSIAKPDQHCHSSGPTSNCYNSRFQANGIERKSQKVKLRVHVRQL